MEVIFVSGAYRAPTVKGIKDNIAHARREAIKLWQQGYAVITPHLNTAHFDGKCPDHVWLEGDLEILQRCDAIYMLSKWQNSEGARAEHDMALLRCMEIQYEISPGVYSEDKGNC